MKGSASIVVLLLFIAAIRGEAQSAFGGNDGAQDTQTRGFWTDPVTGLMWAAKDNGKDISWKDAMKYCRDLRLVGYLDWRLASLGELEGLFDDKANAVGRAGPPKDSRPSTWHIKGNLFLTGNQWSSTRLANDQGRPSGYASRYHFNEGRVFNGDELWFHTNKRALCVRASKATQDTRPSQ